MLLFYSQRWGVNVKNINIMRNVRVCVSKRLNQIICYLTFAEYWPIQEVEL